MLASLPHIWRRGEKADYSVMALHGTLTQFAPEEEYWTAYVERLEHYFAANDVVEQRFKFNSRVRTKEESIAVYLAALREICEYGETLKEMLRDRLV